MLYLIVFQTRNVRNLISFHCKPQDKVFVIFGLVIFALEATSHHALHISERAREANAGEGWEIFSVSVPRKVLLVFLTCSENGSRFCTFVFHLC